LKRQLKQDLYLPCGVKSLAGLRQSMIAEEMTLVALSRAMPAAACVPECLPPQAANIAG
jgi:hypothetical protein